MSPIRAAFVSGVKRVVSAPALLAGVFLVTLLMALPLALTLRGMLEDHLGSSLAAAEAADGVNYDWWQEFASQAAGIGTTFSPSIIGFAAVLDNVGSVMDGRGEIAPIAGALGAYLLVWTFLLGGIIDRYARQRPTRSHGFFAASGVFFMRFLRLAVVAGAAYWFLFAYVHHWMFDTWLRAATRDLAVERTAFLWRVLMYAAFGSLLILLNVLFDYAKVRAVVEDRRSMIGALFASARFIRRNPAHAFGLYAANAIAFLLVLAVWALAAPGAGGDGFSMWLGLAAGQAYIAARLAAKLLVVASETALFQGSLAHAAFTAQPELSWPESPSAEVITPAS